MKNIWCIYDETHVLLSFFWGDNLALVYICIPWMSFCKWRFNLVRLIYWIWFSSHLTDIVSLLWHYYSPITGKKVRSGLVMKGTHPEHCGKNFKWGKREKKCTTLIHIKRPFFHKWLFWKSPQEVLVLNIMMSSPVHPGYRLQFVSDADIYNFCSSV